jgi:hypothetical protein
MWAGKTRHHPNGYSASAMAVKAGTANRRTTVAGLWPFANEQEIEPD